MERYHLTKVTADKAKESSEREYNPQVWERNVDSYLKYKNVQFFQKINGKFIVLYEIPEGLILVQAVSYHSTISNAGFLQCLFVDCDSEFKAITEYIEENDFSFKPDPGKMVMFVKEFTDENGERGAVVNTTEARRYLVEIGLPVTNSML